MEIRNCHCKDGSCSECLAYYFRAGWDAGDMIIKAKTQEDQEKAMMKAAEFDLQLRTLKHQKNMLKFQVELEDG